MYKMKYSIQNINNGALSGAKPMPLKDSTSDNQASFNMARHTYLETVPASSEHPGVQLYKKSFVSRDASSVVENRRNTAVGKGSLNASGELYSFTSYNDINASATALRRARAGGSVAPPKKMRGPQMHPHQHFRRFNTVRPGVWCKINTLRIFMEIMEAICIIKYVYLQYMLCCGLQLRYL